MKTSTIFWFLILNINSLFLLTSCELSKSCEYPYYKDLGFYFKSEHNLDINHLDNAILYITPISDNCDNCIAINLSMLESLRLPKNDILIPVFIGKKNEKDFEKLNSITTNTSSHYFDKSLEIYKYQTGFGKPLLIHIVKGKCVYFMEVKDDKVEDAFEYIININSQET